MEMFRIFRRVALWGAACVGAAAVVGIAALQASQGDTTDPPPARQPDVTPVIGPAGQEGPFNFWIPERVADPGDPIMHGDFRLIPWGYSRALSQTSAPFPQGSAVHVAADAVEGSPLREEPAYLPDGYELAWVGGVQVGGQVASVGFRYEGPSFPITLSRRIISQHPIDVHLSPDGSHIIVEPGEIQGVEAVFEKARPGSRFQVPISVRFTRGEEEVIVTWRMTGPNDSASQFAEIVSVAESLFR